MGCGTTAAAPAVTTSATSGVDRIRRRLLELAPARTWRIVGAVAAATLSVVVSSGGLFFYLREAQVALLAGACAGLIAPSRKSAAAVAAASVLAGLAVGPASAWSSATAGSTLVLAALAGAVLAAAVGFGVKIAAHRWRRSGSWIVWAVVGLLVANVWITTIRVGTAVFTDANGRATTPFYQQLKGTAAAEAQSSDESRYQKVLRAVERGRPFYPTWHDVFGPMRAKNASAGASVFNYHLPTLFWFWAALPGSDVSVAYAYLVLLSLAIVSVPFVTRGTVRLPLAIPGAAAVASYLFIHGYSLKVLDAEPWAGALAVLAVAAWALSSRGGRWRAWAVAAVALGLLAALAREPAVLVLIAGLASAILIRDAQRRFRVAAWGLGVAAFAGLYAAHYVNVRPLLWGPEVGAVFRVSGLDTVISALTYGTPALGHSGPLTLVLACAGFLGIVQIRDRRTRLFVGIAVFSSLLTYLFVNNGAVIAATRAPVNYWGVVVVPVIYACIPALFAVVPTMSGRE